MNPGSYTKLRDLSYEFRSVPYRETEWVGNGQKGWMTILHKVPTGWHWDFLRSKYYECTQILEIFEGSFEEFKKGIESGFYQRTWRPSRWDRQYEALSRRTKFVQKGFAKKELSENETRKREWKQKKYKGGKAKNSWRRPWGPGRWFKKSATRQHRGMERQMISHGRYEEMDGINSHKGAKRFYDWW